MGIFLYFKKPNSDCFKINLKLYIDLIIKDTRNSIIIKDRTKPTDTGGLVEYTKALERIMLKELGKIIS